MRIRAFCGLTITGLLLAACGGGGGDDSGGQVNKEAEVWPMPAVGAAAVVNLAANTVDLGTVVPENGEYPYIQHQLALADDGRALVLSRAINYEPTKLFTRDDLSVRVNNQWGARESVDLPEKGHLNAPLQLFSHPSGAVALTREPSIYLTSISNQLPALLRSVSADTSTQQFGTYYHEDARLMNDGSLISLRSGDSGSMYSFLRYSQEKKLEGPTAIFTVADAVFDRAGRPTTSSDGSVTTVSAWCYQDISTREFVITAALSNPVGLSTFNPFEVTRIPSYKMSTCPELKSASVPFAATIAWAEGNVNQNSSLQMAYISMQSGIKISLRKVSDDTDDKARSYEIRDYTLNMDNDKNAIFLWRENAYNQMNVARSRIVWRKYTPENIFTPTPAQWSAVTVLPFSEYEAVKEGSQIYIPFEANDMRLAQGPNGSLAAVWLGLKEYNKVPEKTLFHPWPILAAKYAPGTGWSEPKLLANMYGNPHSLAVAINGKGAGLAAFVVPTWCLNAGSSCSPNTLHIMATDF